MTYKNSVKLLANNFSIVWKQLLFLIVGITLTVLIASVVALPVFKMLSDGGWVESLKDFVETIYTRPSKIVDDFVLLSKDLGFLLKNNFSSLWGSYIGTGFIFVFMGAFWNFIACYTAGEVLNAKMSSLAEFGYTNKLIVSLKKSIPFAIFRFVLSIPFYGLYVLFSYIYLICAKTTVIAIVLLPVLIVFITIAISLKITLLAGMMPVMINEGVSAGKSFSSGLNVTSKRFARTFSNAIVTVLTIMFVNLFLGVFTLGAGLVLTIPASGIFLALFSLLTYYSATKRNFYVSESMIVQLK